jgi:hypothetical protein
MMELPVAVLGVVIPREQASGGGGALAVLAGPTRVSEVRLKGVSREAMVRRVSRVEGDQKGHGLSRKEIAAAELRSRIR